MGRRQRRSVLEYGVVAVVAVLLALAVQAYVVKPYRIPSPSMAATLRPGDRVLVNRVVYRLHPPRNGDIIVFRYPENEDFVFIKRVVGVPGDVLQARGGTLYVNGRALHEGYVRRVRDETVPTEPAGPIPGTTMTEPWALEEPYTVPAGEYFVMGDNRTDSKDSRVWGAVPAADIIGEAFAVYWPVGRWSVL
jgi:signal peptidase I